MYKTQKIGFSCLVFTAVLGTWFTGGTNVQAQIGETPSEPDLIAILQSDAPDGDKAVACKQLAVFGSAQAVPQLAKHLSDPQLASWARIALEAIPGSEADAALRDSLGKLAGKLLVGAINSVAFRRDERSVEALARLLPDSDIEIAASAAAALGRIGNVAARQLLEQRLTDPNPTLRSTAAEGCIYCAERLLSSGNKTGAIELYDRVRLADVPTARIIEATRGAILARDQDGMVFLVEQLRSPDKQFYQIGLSTLREISPSRADSIVFAELGQLPPTRAALVVQALVDRPGAVELSQFQSIANEHSGLVQIAAIEALGKIGNASCVSQLIDASGSTDINLALAAKKSLTELAGDDVNLELIRRLRTADKKSWRLLLEIVGLRQMVAVEELVKALADSDPEIRAAALTSLGRTVPADQLSILIQQVAKPLDNEDTPAALAALKAAAIRMPDREACAAELATAFQKSTGTIASSLLEIIGAVGGTQALSTVEAAARSNDGELQNVATRLLGDWMTIDAAPVLLGLTGAGMEAKYQVRAVRGYLRIARQFTMSDTERVSMCQQAWQICQKPAEQKLLLEILKRYPGPETFRLAAEARQVPEIKADATAAMLAISQALGNNSKELELLLSKDGLRKVQLEIVRAEYGAGESQTEVTKVLQRLAKDQAWIPLPSANYNEVFSGDPAPGMPKQLTIQYRLDGKPGKVTLAENAMIFLPDTQ